MPDASYLHTTFNGASVIRTPAEIDITTAEQLRAALLEAAEGEQPTVVVDMTRTVFCDSSGLHALLRARNRIASDGGDLRLIIPAGGVVARIITLTGLDTVLRCFPTLAEAVAGPPAVKPSKPGRPDPPIAEIPSPAGGTG